MNIEQISSWGQLVFYVAVSACAIVLALVQLFKTMGVSYGSIISALQNQNVNQQGQIDGLSQRLHLADKECLERLARLEAVMKVHQLEALQTRQAVDILGDSVNKMAGGEHG